MSAKFYTIGGNTVSYGGFLLREAGAGALTITKTVTGTGFDASRTFAITITFDKAVSFKVDGVSVGPVSSYTMHLHHSQSCALTEIPELTQYEVTEELTAEDISLGYDDGPVVGGTGVIREGQPKACSIANTYDQYYVVGAKTVRFQFSNLNYDPTAAGAFPDTDPSAFTWTRVSSNPNRWDYHRESSNWDYAFNSKDPLAGLVPHFYGQDTGDIEVIEANLTGVTSGTEMFSHIDNLVAVRKWSGSSGITSTFGMFDNCFNLESVPTMDFSGKSVLQSVFRRTKLTSVNLITSSALTDCVGVFEFCKSLTAVTISNTSNVVSMAFMFRGCTSLAVAPALTTSKVTSMPRMFDGCTSLTAAPAYNMSKVTDASSMFEGCTSLASVPAIDTSKVVDASGMFAGCTSLTAAPSISTESVENANRMFDGCTGITSVPNYSLSKNEDASNMFRGCTALTTFPALYIGRATTAASMFSRCTALTAVPALDVGASSSTKYLQDVVDMFDGCRAVTSGALDLYTALSGLSSVSTHYRCFKDCGRDTTTGAAELAQIPSDWK